jgi:hypothetical protein
MQVVWTVFEQPGAASVQQTACRLTLAAYRGIAERVAGALLGSAVLTNPRLFVIYTAIRTSPQPKTRERVEVPEWAAFLANRRLCFT